MGIDSFSKFDEHGTRAGKIFQVLLTIGMDTKRSIRELAFSRRSRSQEGFMVEVRASVRP